MPHPDSRTARDPDAAIYHTPLDHADPKGRVDSSKNRHRLKTLRRPKSETRGRKRIQRFGPICEYMFRVG